MSMFLTEEDIINLTGKQRRNAQMKELNILGITFRKRGDGSLVVMTAHVEKILDGKIPSGLESTNEVEPNWGVV